jgi:regulator of telomere elongation helicase 1
VEKCGETRRMVQLSVRGLNVEFPFEPYPCQVDYIDKVLEALTTGNNALLESPTGTGKTICLLCATLAWQAHEKKMKPNKVSIGYNLPSQPNVTFSGPNSKIIIYASRTHSQLSQVVSELRRSGYTPRMTIMASREQLCINDRISNTLRGGALNHACNKLSAQRSCMFKNNLENYSGGAEGSGSGSPILDIESLVNLGRQDAICPYFYSRDNATKAELVLLPYNYLIDSSIRTTLRGVDWQDACIIIDEAHNLEQIASDASSFALSTADLAACITELQSVIRLLQLQSAALPTDDSGDKKGKKNGSDPTLTGGRNGYGERPNLQQCAIILRALFNLEDKVTKLEILSQKSGPVSLTDGSKCLVLPGSWFVSTLEEVGLPFVNVNPLPTSPSLLCLPLIPPRASRRSMS